MSYAMKSGRGGRGISEHHKSTSGGGIVTYHSESRPKERFDRSEWERAPHRDREAHMVSSVSVGYPYTQGLLPIPHLYTTSPYTPSVIPMSIISPPLVGVSTRKRERDEMRDTRDMRGLRGEIRDVRDFRDMRDREGRQNTFKRFPRKDHHHHHYEKDADNNNNNSSSNNSAKHHNSFAIPSHLSSPSMTSWTSKLQKGDSFICNLTCFPDPSFVHFPNFSPSSLVMNKKTDIDYLVLNTPAGYSIHYLHPTGEKDLVGYLQFLVYLLERRRVGTVSVKDDKGVLYVVHLLPPCPETFSMIGKCKERTLYAMVVQKDAGSKRSNSNNNNNNNNEEDDDNNNDDLNNNENEDHLHQYQDPPSSTDENNMPPSPVVISSPRNESEDDS